MAASFYGIENLVRVYRKIDGAIYKAILEKKNMLDAEKGLKLDRGLLSHREKTKNVWPELHWNDLDKNTFMWIALSKYLLGQDLTINSQSSSPVLVSVSYFAQNNEQKLSL